MESVVCYKKDNIYYFASNYMPYGKADMHLGREKGFRIANGIIMAFQGFDRECQVLDTLSLGMFNKKEFNRKNIVIDFIPYLRAKMHEYGETYKYDSGAEYLKVDMILAKGDKAFYINCDYDVLEIGNYYAIGQNSNSACILLDAIDNSKDINQEFLKLYKSLEKVVVAVSNTIYVANTKDCKAKKISWEEK